MLLSQAFILRLGALGEVGDDHQICFLGGPPLTDPMKFMYSHAFLITYTKQSSSRRGSLMVLETILFTTLFAKHALFCTHTRRPEISGISLAIVYFSFILFYERMTAPLSHFMTTAPFFKTFT